MQKYSTLVALLVVSFAFPALEVQASKILKVSGQVRLHRSGEVRPAKEGMDLKANDHISVAAKSLALVSLDDGSEVKLGPQSELTIKENSPKKVRLTLNRGSAFSKVKKALKKRGKSFRIRTASAVMGVRGTEFFVSYGKTEKDVWMCVREGEVGITGGSDKKETVVPAGKGVFVKKGAVTPPKEYAWTKKLNWNFDPNSKLENDVDLEDMYEKDPLDADYD